LDRLSAAPNLGTSVNAATSKQWRNGTSFGLTDLEAIVNVAGEARELISVHALKR